MIFSLLFKIFAIFSIICSTVIGIPPPPPRPPHQIFGGIWSPEEGPFGAIKDSLK
ncbi:uncharacterized protein CELE_Y54F10BM.23 [Caenorhabditis elegans]|uniref:Uncharacterized protein n=1 Tax=Caenorhabditis elegans TaxID=6239 RepID=A0A679L8K6_CAEEL|nr:Uncharacterized protein CELE_Y54F10BM.23 [Caenorhabditis elegans]CAA9991452.1 Uncharacterized protein CELE_Y54F10BM.23 [Caenorhabditis elegans]